MKLGQSDSDLARTDLVAVWCVLGVVHGEVRVCGRCFVLWVRPDRQPVAAGWLSGPSGKYCYTTYECHGRI